MKCSNLRKTNPFAKHNPCCSLLAGYDSLDNCLTSNYSIPEKSLSPKPPRFAKPRRFLAKMLYLEYYTRKVTTRIVF